ncbi:hypothetical protein BQ9231_00290 [Cedratvirus lausannensis]|uniref:Uncharacterized protein n=2 Tax=Pithoviruses TaxID=2023203 RepID=A0A285PWY4_9VIRU|nr:hypothetical protein BQ9231_00290 [Cedratvirus lausannensis]SPN79501.1 Hypothetical protein ZAZAV_343 [Cedratvirus Zaza IHUMI]
MDLTSVVNRLCAEEHKVYSFQCNKTSKGYDPSSCKRRTLGFERCVRETRLAIVKLTLDKVNSNE